MSVINLNTNSFSDFIAKADVPVVVDFWATWCGPCKMMAPVLEEISQKYEGKLIVAKVDVDDEPALAMKYNIDSIPNLKLFKNGVYTDESIGYKPQVMLEQWISPYIN